MPDDDFDIYGDDGYDLPSAQEGVCPGMNSLIDTAALFGSPCVTLRSL